MCHQHNSGSWNSNPLMAKKQNNRNGLYPPAAAEMNSNMMLILMSCVVKCVTVVIKGSAKLCRCPVVTRAIQRDCSLVTLWLCLPLSYYEFEHPRLLPKSQTKKNLIFFYFSFVTWQPWSSSWPPLLQMSVCFSGGCLCLKALTPPLHSITVPMAFSQAPASTSQPENACHSWQNELEAEKLK